MKDYPRDVARRACVEAGQAPADGDWDLDDFFAYAVGRAVKGPHVAVFETAARVRQSRWERSGPREELVDIVANLNKPVAQAAERLAAIEPGLTRYLRAIEACDNVATPEGRTFLAFGDEKRVPGGTERAAATRELVALIKRAAELVPSVARGLDDCRPDILRANMLTDTKGERAAMISIMTELGMGPTEIAEALGEAPRAPRKRDRKVAQERRDAADAVSEVLRSIRRKLQGK